MPPSSAPSEPATGWISKGRRVIPVACRYRRATRLAWERDHFAVRSVLLPTRHVRKTPLRASVRSGDAPPRRREIGERRLRKWPLFDRRRGGFELLEAG